VRDAACPLSTRGGEGGGLRRRRGTAVCAPRGLVLALRGARAPEAPCQEPESVARRAVGAGWKRPEAKVLVQQPVCARARAPALGAIATQREERLGAPRLALAARRGAARAARTALALRGRRWQAPPQRMSLVT